MEKVDTTSRVGVLQAQDVVKDFSRKITERSCSTVHWTQDDKGGATLVVHVHPIQTSKHKVDDSHCQATFAERLREVAEVVQPTAKAVLSVKADNGKITKPNS